MDIPDTGAEAIALKRLHDQHAAALWRYAWRLTGDHAHAQDVVQETLLRAWQHPHVLNNGQSPRGWLFTVARNMVIDDRRSAKVGVRALNSITNTLQRLAGVHVAELDSARKQIVDASEDVVAGDDSDS